MKPNLRHLIQIPFLLLSCCVFGQDISLYEQFNGRYDFTFVGNTLNPQENSYMVTPTIFTTSSAELSLAATDQIEAAFLYWAGSGTGDFDILLNGEAIAGERTFAYERNVLGTIYDYFSAFADVTQLVQLTGNGQYTVSELDVTDFIESHFGNRTNFAGWALVIIYKNPALPLNQLNVYDGLQAVPTEINITLNSLNVIDNQDAKIGFLAWEGDVNIQLTESLKINGSTLSNLPLNPPNNAFNGTNSFTGASNLFNMDLDVYNIQNNIDVGDSTAEIQLTSGQDFVMINAIVTKLNSQLPDATVVIDQVVTFCRSQQIDVDYTIYNLNSTATLPAGVPIGIYIGGVRIAETTSGGPIPIGESQPGQITITVPENTPNPFELEFYVDADSTGNSTVLETNENNNSFTIEINMILPPEFNVPPDLMGCNRGNGLAYFDFSHYGELVVLNPDHTVAYFNSEEDAVNNVNPITNTTNYSPDQMTKTIFIRITSDDCYAVTFFELRVKNCPPVIYNFVSVNNDGSNDSFHIEGLRDIFLNYKLSVYNRWGALLWTGNNNIPEWNGIATKGIVLADGEVPDGTYYYVLELNDPDYPEPMIGFLYLVR